MFYRRRLCFYFMRFGKLLVSVLCLLLLLGCSGGSGSEESSSSLETSAARTMVGHWNHVSINASGFDHSATGAQEQMGPTRSSRAMAIVHIAIFDAVNAARGYKYQPYFLRDEVQGEVSPEAAIARAARDTLISLFPAQAVNFENDYRADLNAIPDGPAKDAGLALGARAAELILSRRNNDGSQAYVQNRPYKSSEEAGRWRADPTNPEQQPLGAKWSKVRPFVLNRASQFRAAPPPALNSTAYAEAYAEVYRLGGDGQGTPTERSEEQTQIGLFWAYDGTPSLCAPPRMYNQIVMQIASDRGVTDNLELARLLALVNVAMADSAIAAWESKYYYDFWRPITAIRESDPGSGPTGSGDGNNLTPGDPSWTPLGAPASNLSANNFTPPFPAYVSGHATFGSAVFEILRNYFGTDEIAFTFVSDELNGITKDRAGNTRPLLPRSFSRLSQAEEENAQSRIYLGIHWSFDKSEGMKMGRSVADYVFANSFN